MSLQPYVRQLNPRNESYTPPVDKVQNFLSEAVSGQPCYSSTNQGKYKKGDQFYSNENVGVSWTVFVSR